MAKTKKQDASPEENKGEVSTPQTIKPAEPQKQQGTEPSRIIVDEAKQI